MYNYPMFIVTVGILSQTKNGKPAYLLVKSKNDFGKYTGFYYPPGGHVEGNENPAQALVREMKEELSLDVKPTKEIDITPGDMQNQETHWWHCELLGGTLSIQKEELSDASYFTQEEMKQLPIWPATKQFFDKHIFNNNSL